MNTLSLRCFIFLLCGSILCFCLDKPKQEDNVLQEPKSVLEQLKLAIARLDIHIKQCKAWICRVVRPAVPVMVDCTGLHSTNHSYNPIVDWLAQYKKQCRRRHKPGQSHCKYCP